MIFFGSCPRSFKSTAFPEMELLRKERKCGKRPLLYFIQQVVIGKIVAKTDGFIGATKAFVANSGKNGK